MIIIDDTQINNNNEYNVLCQALGHSQRARKHLKFWIKFLKNHSDHTLYDNDHTDKWYPGG